MGVVDRSRRTIQLEELMPTLVPTVMTVLGPVLLGFSMVIIGGMSRGTADPWKSRRGSNTVIAWGFVLMAVGVSTGVGNLASAVS
jgi:hypothetical protein